MSLLIAPILFVAAVLYVTYPLMRESILGDPVVEASKRDRMLKSKDDAIDSLKDIEMDYRMGKLSDEDYALLKSEFEQRAVEALQALERSPDGAETASGTAQ